MLLLPDAWTWDFWLADDGERFHAFYLRASRALLDPERRHRHASVGHAVSPDLREWTVVADALVPSDGPAFDDLAIWTGSVVADPAGGWRWFYTGISRAEGENVQRIGSATSPDLVTWTRTPLLLEADPQWYEPGTWRDPWVFRLGDEWHLLITARAGGNGGAGGVVGHATSPDLITWTVRPPLSAHGAGFGHVEVMQVAVVDDGPVLIFSPDGDGVWFLPLESSLGPFDLRTARRLTGRDLYAGRVTHDRAGQAVLLAFRMEDENGTFVGGIIDPVPFTRTG